MATASALVTITVTCPAPIARDDSRVLTAPGVAVGSVLANDTYTGSASLAAVTPVPAELSFNTTTGAVVLAPGAAYGVYSFTYQLCALGGCDTAVVTVEYRRQSQHCPGAGHRRFPVPPPPPPLSCRGAGHRKVRR